MKTEAWVLRRGELGTTEPGELELDSYELPEMTEHDVLADAR